MSDHCLVERIDRICIRAMRFNLDNIFMFLHNKVNQKFVLFLFIELMYDKCKIYTIHFKRGHEWKRRSNDGRLENGTTASIVSMISEAAKETVRESNREKYELERKARSKQMDLFGSTVLSEVGEIVSETKQYTFTLNANGGTVSNSSISATYDSSYTLPVPTRDYYIFAGWYDGTMQYENGILDKAGDITLTAQWIPVSYTITYNLSNGTNSSQNPNDFTVESSKISLMNPTKTGYKFLGWYGDSSCSNQITEIAAGSHENVSLYAKWEIINYTITYNLNGGTISGTKKTTFTVNDLPLVLPTPSKWGMLFLNWSKDTFNGEIISEITELGDVAVVASYMDPGLKLDFPFLNKTYYVVKDYTGSATHVDVPAYYNGLPVREIGENAFSYTTLVSINLPNTITTINSAAFENAKQLKTINIPEGVTRLSSSAFQWCQELTDISLPSTLKVIEDWCFYGCSSLKQISLPSSLTEIGGLAFIRCTSLQSITIPGGVKTVDGFSDCSNLVSVYLSEGITTIGNNAFENCEKLTTIVLPDTLESIEYQAFSDCSSLTKIIIPASVTYMDIPFSSSSAGKLTIYCRATMLPPGWHARWNYIGCDVVWGYTGN